MSKNHSFKLATYTSYHPKRVIVLIVMTLIPAKLLIKKLSYYVGRFIEKESLVLGSKIFLAREFDYFWREFLKRNFIVFFEYQL